MDGPKIPRSPELSPDESAAEADFASAIEADVDGHLAQYDRRFGKIINTDSAKLLYKPYADDPKLRVKFSRAAYGPAKWLMNELFDRRVRNEEVRIVNFMSGGTASGKSSSAEPVASELAAADVIVDGTLSNQALAAKQVGLALELEKTIQVNYIHCDVRRALKRAVARAQKINRTLSLNVFAGSHFHCRCTMAYLLRTFGSNIDFSLTVIDNNQFPRRLPLTETEAFLEEYQISDLESLERDVDIWFAEVCDEYERENGNLIPPHIRAAFRTRGREVSKT